MKIRIEKTDEDSIKLRDCKAGELVRLADNSVCLVVDALGVVRDDFVDGGLAAVWLKDGCVQMCAGLSEDMISGEGSYRCVRMCNGLSEDMISGEGSYRIVDRLGLLVVEGE
jgi:hypothetical protein